MNHLQWHNFIFIRHASFWHKKPSHLLKSSESFNCLKNDKPHFIIFSIAKPRYFILLKFFSFNKILFFFFNITSYLLRIKYVNAIIHFHNKMLHLVGFIKKTTVIWTPNSYVKFPWNLKIAKKKKKNLFFPALCWGFQLHSLNNPFQLWLPYLE